jgi:hypothetical protein
MTKTNAALLVANDDECCETEATAALDDLGDAVDRDKLVDEFAIALFTALAVVPLRPSFLCHCPLPFSFPGAIGKQMWTASASPFGECLRSGENPAGA